MFRIFGWSTAVTVAALIGALAFGGPAYLAIVAILIVLEVSLSFDNAVVNAKILARMSPFWQTIFLTIGIAIAVFGMRLLFPLLLVAVTAGLGPIEVINLAMEGGDGPGSYSAVIHDAHPAIAGFGGMFLGMLFLDWLFDEEREHHWLTWLERPLMRIGQLEQLSVVVAAIGLMLAATLLAGENASTVMISGLLGIVTYLLVNGLGAKFEAAGLEQAALAAQTNGRRGPSEAVKTTGKAGFFLFLYLEVLDASFSFDGVVGAFAITQDIVVIAIGLGVGAFWIRALTVYLVRRGTLDAYVYLEHGAHWAIGALSVLLLVTIAYEVPEVITGLIGVAFIVAALISSAIYNRNNPTPKVEAPTDDTVAPVKA
jgi:hypothetical protein